MANSDKPELDLLLERALKESVSDEAPPDRVWENIVLRLRQRDGQDRSRRGYLAELASEALVWMGGVATTARIILTPFVPGSYEELPDSLAFTGQGFIPVHYSIHR